MIRNRAVADVFITAFKSLDARNQKAVLFSMLKMKHLRNDLMDIAVAESRSREKSRPFLSFLKEIKK